MCTLSLCIWFCVALLSDLVCSYLPLFLLAASPFLPLACATLSTDRYICTANARPCYVMDPNNPIIGMT